MKKISISLLPNVKKKEASNPVPKGRIKVFTKAQENFLKGEGARMQRAKASIHSIYELKIEGAKKEEMLKVLQGVSTSRTETSRLANSRSLSPSVDCPVEDKPQETRVLHSGGKSPHTLEPVGPLVRAPRELPFFVELSKERGGIKGEGGERQKSMKLM